MKIPILDKIEAKIHRFQGGCWVWKGDIFKDSTPNLRFMGNRVKVREFLYGLEFGIFPPEKVYRTCLNCLCVNPLHMSLTEDRRSVIAKLYDDEDHNHLNYDPETGEIRRGFLPPTKTNNPKTSLSRKESFKIAPESQFFKGNEYGIFIQDGKDERDNQHERMEQRETDNAGSMDGLPEEI